ncbi:neoverrucotoxin subunit alpha-like [Sander lucioperca]|uniref:neoverrucotoxin subunit alpha-like n=1 Tax=Sander lucioperca TaxID=283035 RepID=UPI0016538870|nr:neoverrucotoxin subunit alpha-like [Sander lucioperca]
MRRGKHDELADRLQSKSLAADGKRKLKSKMQEKFQRVFEGVAEAGNPTPLNEMFREIYLIKGGTAEELEDSGVELISVGLKSPHCTLETLSLSGCLISEEGCSSLVSALSSNPSHLRELDLSYNHPGDSGVKLELTLDTNTVNRYLKLSDNNRKVTNVLGDQPYPDHPERFDCLWPQLLCRDGLTGRCYWEVERKGDVHVAVSYRGIRRRGQTADCMFGCNDQSWSLRCSDDGYSVSHNDIQTSIPSSSVSGRVAVYVDVPAGSLSFYSVSSDSLIHLHTFNTTFTEPLYPGFGIRFSAGASVSLCPLKDGESPPVR